jgi:hypothetical protein
MHQYKVGDIVTTKKGFVGPDRAVISRILEGNAIRILRLDNLTDTLWDTRWIELASRGKVHYKNREKRK